MQLTLRGMARLAGAVIAAGLVAGCTLPRSGPTTGEIMSAGDSEYGMHIVMVNPSVAAASRATETLGFGPGFVEAGVVSADQIAPGDTLAISVWENVEAGLLAGIGQKVTAVEELQVDQSGEIFVPYVGRVQAAGRDPDALRRDITESLSAQTPDPQVEVRRVAGDGTTVSVMGGVARPGVYPIDAPTRRLSSMLALAGGVSLIPDVAQIRLERRGSVGRIWLQDLYDNPRYDVALRPGDRIIVEEDRRSFTALGASSQQARVPFTKRDMTALEAIAAAGGLDGNAADPTGVFIFRSEDEAVARRVTGDPTLVGPQRVAYLLNLTKAEGLFSAREFIVRDEDTVYITEAPFASWSRVLGLAGRAVNITGSVAAIAN